MTPRSTLRFKVGDVLRDRSTGTMWLLVGELGSEGVVVGFSALTLLADGVDAAWNLERVGDVQDTCAGWLAKHAERWDG